METLDQQIANLSPAKRALLDFRLKNKERDISVSPAIIRRAERESAVLSFAQQRLWFLDQLEPGNAFYNMPRAIRMGGALNVEALDRTLAAIIWRHESLRTTFDSLDGSPVQIINKGAEVQLPVIDLSELPAEERDAEARRLVSEDAKRPFDLAKGPLMRASLLRLAEDDHVLLLTMHHIVSDGWSAGILMRELTALYEAFSEGKPSPLAKLPIQYADFSVWQREWLQGDVLEKQLAYWSEKLGGELPRLELPTDKPRPVVQTYRGSYISTKISKDISEQLKAMAQREGVTLYMLLLAAFQVLLYRYSGQEDIIVGSPIAGRNRAETEGLIGFFVNTLVVRTDLTGNPTFRDLLKRVREVALGAYAHQDLPFEKLVEELRPERSLSYSPIFQVIFALQNAPTRDLELGKLKLSSLSFENKTTRFDLEVHIWELGNGSLSCSFIYNTDLFDESTVVGMGAHYQTLLESIVADPGREIQELRLLTAAEEEELIVSWNDTGTNYPRDKSIVELFEAQVKQSPDAVAVVCDDKQLTYRQLNERANQLAHHLQNLGVGPEVLVAISLDRSLEMIIGLLGILKAGGAYVPLDRDYPQARVSFMLADGQAPVLITQERLLESLPESDVRVVCLDRDRAAITSESRANPESAVRPENLAYIIYTSGSTGKPKGVGITHASLMNLVSWHQNAFEVKPRDRASLLAGVGFDAAVWETWPYLTAGASLHLPDQGTRLSPELLRDWLVAEEITVSFLPTALAERVLTLQWPLNTALRILLTGAETLRHFPSTNLPFQLVNNYGPTECTVVATSGFVLPGIGITSLPTIGRPIANTTVYILDGQMRPVPIGVPGELYIGGDGLARGYLNRSELTSEKFIANPFSDDPTARLYKTGDLARYLADGNIEFLGRIDHQVKVRGYRIELGEIESVLNEHADVSESVVVAREDEPGDKRLVAYLVGRENEAPGLSELRGFLKEKLPEYMVPTAFVVLERLPLTPSGKVDRRALPAPERSGLDLEDQYQPPRTPTEDMFAAIWAGILGRTQVGIHDNFFELGGHSLIATRIISRVREAFQIELPLRTLFESPTIARLAEKVDAVRHAASGLPMLPLQKVSRDGSLPLSFSQQRLWFLDQLEPNNPFYNMPQAIRLTGVLDTGALEQTIAEIIKRHESLRTVFKFIDGMPTQVIKEAVPLTISLTNLGSLPESEREAEARRLATEGAKRPFDLGKGPLLRAGLLRLAEEDHVLLLTMHHIIGDGWSNGVLTRELTTLYEAFSEGKPSPLAELPIQYADFSVWQREWLQGEVLEKQLAYWRERLGDDLPVLELPKDRVRPAVQTYRGNSHSIVLPQNLADQLKQLSQQKEATLYMVVLAAFQVLLSRSSGQEDIAIGSPIAGRNRAETEGLIGFFVNTLVMRTDLTGNPTFCELLKRVKEVALDAYAHQDLPFEKLVEELQPERDLSQNPLFQVMFALQNAPTKGLELGDLKLSSFSFENKTTRFDLEVHLWERGNGTMTCSFVYNTDLFDERTIVGMARHYQTLLESVVANPESHLSELALLTAEEREQFLVEWNHTQTDYPRDKTIHGLFEEQVERTPEAIAVVYEEKRLSYRKLNERANQLAHYLQKLGVGPDVMVGISMERSVEMVVGLLGILKAGGTYVPLDADYPEQRLRFMLEDTRAPVLITHESLVESLPESGARVVCLDKDGGLISRESAANLNRGARAENLAYVIYTSGSTGKPKGVSVPHRAVSRLVLNTNYIELTSSDRVAQVSNASFDAFTFEIWGALLCGAQLVGISLDVALAPQRLAEQIQFHGISTMFLTTALFNQMAIQAPNCLHRLRNLLFGGEAVDPKWVREVLIKGAPERLLHVYGPTESTTFTSWHLVQDVEEGARTVPIGRPISNTTIYILDRQQQLVPVGVSGELHVGGDGLAAGYLNREELTTEKFIPNPYSEEEGARLYRTGDLARYLPDGNVEFLGRLDQQVKIRGYRIELGEIEAVLSEHAAIKESVVIAREEASGDKRLVAYLVQDLKYKEPATNAEASSEVPTEQVSQWQLLYDQLYSQGSSERDGTFNIVGWNSSYSGEPIPAEEMREWVDSTVERIVGLRPERVLEIGCGTGLLLFRVAPHCSEYLGVDFSQAAIGYLREQLEGMELPQVRVEQKLADELGMEAGSFDVVVLNSVIQYFPNVEYLVRVMEGAVQAVREGGSIFIGDVRSLPLLEAFRASVGMAQAEGDERTEELRQQVQREVNQEEELVIDPSFFQALKERMPEISRVEVMPKRGWRENELACYRYDVVVHLGGEKEAGTEVEWMDWEREGLTLGRVQAELEERKPELMGMMRVPNARVWGAVKALELMGSEEAPETVTELRAALGKGAGVEPEAMWSLSEELPYEVEISWAGGDAEGRYDVLLRRQSGAEQESGARSVVRFPGETIRVKSWSKYANNPLQETFARKLVPQLRSYLKEKLPEYMVPAAFVVMDELPLTPNGKVDRRRLPAPDRSRSELEEGFVAPRDELELQLTRLWEELLCVKPIGLTDNFFELGGHSLLAVGLFAQIEKRFNKNLPLATLFQAPTIEHLARILRQKGSVSSWASLVPIQPSGSKPTLYFIHAGGGNVLCYRALARLLGPDQPVYALQAQGLDGKRPPHASLEEMASHYLKEIRAVQPEGPYHLGGVSSGGAVAFEMAQQLHEQAQEVGLLALIDTFFPGFPRYMPNRTLFSSRLHRTVVRADAHLGELIMRSPRERLKYILDGLGRIKKNVKKNIVNGFGSEDPLRRTIQSVREANLHAFKTYKPKTYSGRITIFWCTEMMFRPYLDNRLGWDVVAESGLEVHVVPGSHTGLLDLEPNARVLAQELNKCLQKIQTAVPDPANETIPGVKEIQA